MASTSSRWTILPLACPRCGAPVELSGAAFTCTAGHAAGALDGELANFARERSGVDADLAAFWASCGEYYALTERANSDYGDSMHEAHRVLLDALAAEAPRRLLDVGCGTAEVATILASRLPRLEYVGVEVSPLALRRALELARPGTFLVADGEALPFADGSFDAVISLFALEHFVRPRECLAEMLRVTRHGGLVGLVTPAYDRPWGTVPSLRLGSASHPRRHPVNVATYAVKRAAFASRQLAKQLRYAVDRRYTSFEAVPHPLVLEGRYEADLDATHVVSGRSVLRFLQEQGAEVLQTSLGLLRLPALFWVIARRR